MVSTCGKYGLCGTCTFSYDYMLFCVYNWWTETGGFANKINKLWIFYKHTSCWAVYTDERERGCVHGLAFGGPRVREYVKHWAIQRNTSGDWDPKTEGDEEA